MDTDLAEGERRLWNHLTSIKLALQLLTQRMGLSAEQQRVARMALQAADALALGLMAQRRAGSAQREAGWRAIEQTLRQRDSSEGTAEPGPSAGATGARFEPSSAAARRRSRGRFHA